MNTVTLEMDKWFKRGAFTITGVSLSPDDFYKFCQENPLLQVERTSQGEIVVMAPSNTMSDGGNAEATTDLNN